jgi:hypothetical protein
MSEGGGEPARDTWRALALTLVLCALTDAPYLVAALAPPPGRTFVGTFHYVDDFYNYGAFVQQAESGRFLFDDKLALEAHRPVLVNLEWWTVGILSRLLGRRPFLAYRVFAAFATWAFVASVLLWLRTLGVAAAHRTAAATLVCCGGGLGGLLFELTDRPVMSCADLAVGFHPFLSLLAQPHWTAGTALLLAALWTSWRAGTTRAHLGAIALGSALALVRPYDLVLLVAARVVAVALTVEPRRWFERLLPLAGLAPAAGYLGWVFFGSGSFAWVESTAYAAVALPPLDLLFALGPPALCLLAWRLPERAVARGAAAHLAAWLAVGIAFVLFRPVTFSLQFAVGLGVPLLLLGAHALTRWPPSATVLATILLGGSALTAYRGMWRADPNWLVPAERRGAVLALRDACADGGLLMAPSDMGLYAIALTSCRAYVSHPASVGFAERAAETNAFYGGAPPAARRAWLDRRCVTHLALPGEPATAAEAWLGAGSEFRPVGAAGEGPTRISVHARPRPPACPSTR